MGVGHLPANPKADIFLPLGIGHPRATVLPRFMALNANAEISPTYCEASTFVNSLPPSRDLKGVTVTAVLDRGYM